MSNFNRRTVSAATKQPAAVRAISQAVPTTHNLAGGQAFRLTPHYELAFLLLTTFLEPEFYRLKTATTTQCISLIKKLNDPMFAAKAAIFARTQYGMRSISHLVAAEIAKQVKGEQWTKNFFNKVVHRVDDASEILAAYISMYNKPVPNSLKKGLAMALSKFNRYQLAKYKGNSKGIKLVDLFNLVHPKPSEQNAVAFKDLIDGNLASEDTWEAKLSEAGQGVGSEREKAQNKKDAWQDLISTKKIGYFALLRNLRNILEQTDSATVQAACDMLVNEKMIEKSLVLPFRFMTAQNELANMPSQNSDVRRVIAAIDDAIDISLKNVPVFEGETLVVLDDSGSMVSVNNGNYSGGSVTAGNLNPKCPAAIGSLFAAVIAKSNNADLMRFSDDAAYLNYNSKDSVSTITQSIRAKFKSGGTNFNAIFPTANKKYDRVIILSDMQGWVGHQTPVSAYGKYCVKFKANPKIYSFDLSGYGTLQFPQENVFALAGFSEKTLDLMKVLEEDPAALLTQINAISLD